MKYLLSLVAVVAFLFSDQYNRSCFPETEENYSLDRIVLPDWDQTSLSPSGHFRIFYKVTGVNAPDLTDNNENSIPDYIDEVGIAADYTRGVLLSMGYDPEPSPYYDGHDGYYGIFISNRGSYKYGVNLPDGHIEIDNDYSSGYYTTGLQAMRLTVAHEFFHAVQRGYRQPNSDIYFYDMSSTWIEDVIVPDGNDYLEWTDDFFNNPEKSIEDTDGYSIALFGHYLSSQYDNVDDETQSVIIRKMWEDYENGGSAYYSMDDVLSDYLSSFNDAWLEFTALNFFNGIDEQFYYYEDQAQADAIELSTQWLDEEVSLNLSLDNASVSIESFRMLNEQNAILNIIHNHSNYLGNWIILGNNIEDNAVFEARDGTTNQLHKYDEIHFVYSRNPNYYSMEISLTVTPIFAPVSPENLVAYQQNNSTIKLIWESSYGPGDTLNYEVFRNDDSLFSTIDTTFFDTTFEVNTGYTYEVRVVSENGSSEFSNSVSITTWPSIDDIDENTIISVYPNPFVVVEHSIQHLLLDSKTDSENVICEVFNLKGQKVYSENIPFLEQGRQRMPISFYQNQNLPSGIYLIKLRKNGFVIGTQKTILLR